MLRARAGQVIPGAGAAPGQCRRHQENSGRNRRRRSPRGRGDFRRFEL